MRSPLSLFVLRLSWQFANTLLLLASLIAFFFLAGTPAVHAFIADVGQWGYFGAFVTGIFFVSTFTVAPAVVVLFSFARVLPLFPLALVAGLGAMVGDFLLFSFVRDRLSAEWSPLFSRIAETPLGRLFASPFFAWFTPVLGALIIASPLPDELGVGLLGLNGLKSWKMLLITFVLNTAGILLIVFVAALV